MSKKKNLISINHYNISGIKFISEDDKWRQKHWFLISWKKIFFFVSADKLLFFVTYHIKNLGERNPNFDDDRLAGIPDGPHVPFIAPH